MSNNDYEQFKETRHYYVSILLPNSPDRKALVGLILRDLEKVPFAVDIRTPELLIKQKLDAYLLGAPRGEKIYRGMSLDLQVEICGKRPAELYIEEVTDELVMLNFMFKPSEVLLLNWDLSKDKPNQGNRLHLRDFLLALNTVYPVVIGTLALDLVASDILGLEDGMEFSLANKMSFEQLAGPIYVPGSDYSYDFAVINPAASGRSKPIMYSLIGKPESNDPDREAYYLLERVEDLRMTVEKAEQAYSRMYESRHPKDDRDDALDFLFIAIRQATELGLEKEVVRLRSRYEHIYQVYKSQFLL